MPIFYYLLLLAFGAALSSCSLFSRHPGSGYSHTERPPFSQSSLPMNNPYYLQASEQLGVSPQRATAAEARDLSLRAQIIQLKKQLKNTRERQQYYYYEPWFDSDSERLAFLALPNFQARQNWLHQRGIHRRINDLSTDTQSIVEAEDIGLGMQMELVLKSWGEPTRREIAGDPLYRNQKWTYSKYMPSPDGYKLERKSVYFENGRVAGWSMD